MAHFFRLAIPKSRGSALRLLNFLCPGEGLLCFTFFVLLFIPAIVLNWQRWRVRYITDLIFKTHQRKQVSWVGTASAPIEFNCNFPPLLCQTDRPTDQKTEKMGHGGSYTSNQKMKGIAHCVVSFCSVRALYTRDFQCKFFLSYVHCTYLNVSGIMYSGTFLRCSWRLTVCKD